MIYMNVYPSRVWFDSKSEKELDILYSCLQIKDKNSYWRALGAIRKLGYIGHGRRYKELRKAKERILESAQFVKFYDARKKTFGTGLLRRVKRHLKKNGITMKIEDFRKPLPEFEEDDFQFRFLDGMKARPEQVLVLGEALKKGAGIIHCGVNFGKTEVAAAMIEILRRKLKKIPRTIVLVHRVNLAKQTAERFRKHLGVSVRVIRGGHKIPGRITVATVQTAVRLVSKNNFAFKEALRKSQLIFIDELHVNKAKTVRKIMEHCGARMRYGLSGTISKEEAKLLNYISLTGEIIAEVSAKELIDLGHSAKPILRMVWVDAPLVTGNYARSYRRGIIKNKFRNRLVFKEACRYLNKGAKNVMITIARLAHGKILQKKFENIDIRCEFIRGSTPPDIRSRIIKRFIKGKIPVMIVSPVFDVGMSVNEIYGWVNAAGGLGWELVLQRLGRVLRKKFEGENVIHATDFVDNHNRYLLRHSLKRYEYYKEVGAEIKPIGR